MSFGLSAAAIGGIAAGVGAVGGAYISSQGAKSAANTQANAANYAAELQQQQYDQTREDLGQYRALGTDTIPQLQSALNNPLFTSTFGNFTAPTAAEAQATPGYEFTLSQGLKAAQNSASARGLGSSGAALKGASTFASGLADSTYGDTFNRALSAYNANRATFGTNYGVAADNVNRLLGIVGLGENAAVQTGNAGSQAANSIANTITSGAAATAAGQVGAANAINNGISNAISGYQSNQLLSSLRNNNSTLYGGATDAYGNPV